MMLRVVRPGQTLSRALRPLSSSTFSSQSTVSVSAWQRLPLCNIRHPGTVRSFSRFSSLHQQAVAAAQEPSLSDTPRELTTFQELADHGLVSPKVINTLVNQMGIHTMTDVQRLTINECLDGADVIGQAKTGTGKTLAFLMPIIQRILRDPKLEQPSNRYSNRASVGDIRALIISPTRELAEQIAVEAKKVVAGTAVKVQTAVGGTQKSLHLRKMQQEGCHILVGTPGRVKDILSDNYSGVNLDHIETFVLDEADRLLDIGFMPEIEEIQRYMPPRDQKARQTLMFSATVPKEVVGLVRRTLRPDFKFIRTVDPDESPTHESVPQKVVFLRGLQNQLPSILEIASNAIEANKRDPVNNMPFKAIVYFGSTTEVALAAHIFYNFRDPAEASGTGRMYSRLQHPLYPTEVVEMHSRLNQGQRTMNSSRFRNAESAILFSSDVTARGMDFPNVSHVIQVGLPKQATDYVHRIGRTGRAGKKGEGWLLICDDERSQFRMKMGHSGIQIDEERSMTTPSLDMTRGAQLPANVARMMQLIESGVKTVPYSMKAQVYQSLIGVLGQSGRDKQTTIDLMNDLAKYGWGLEKPPALSSGLVNKLGFGRCHGIEIEDRYRQDDNGRGGFESNSRGGRRDDFNPRDPFDMGTSGERGSYRGGSSGGFSRGRERSSRGDRGFNDENRRSFGGRGNDQFGSRGRD